MSKPNQIRINDLARELEVKAKIILEYLPELGLAEKKTHSSSLDVEVAEKVRAHFRAAAEAEEAAERAAVARDRAAKDAKEKQRQAAKTAPAPPVTATPAPAPGAPAAKPTVVLPSEVIKPAPAEGAAPPAVKPAAPALQPATKPAQPAAPPPATRPPMRPAATASDASKPVAPPSRPVRMPTPPPKPMVVPGQPIAKLPMRPPMRPGGPPRPGSGQRPGGGRPGGPGRPSLRSPISSAPLPPPKVEPGKPIFQRKPLSRGRHHIDKRFEEGERKLHPVRARPGVSGRRAAPVAQMPPPVAREPREITITEGITVRELAEKLDVRTKELLKTLLDRGVFASINQALDAQTATSLAETFNGVVSVVSFEEQAILEVAKDEKPENLKPRAPVVTVMGHVDHGKTSLLDALRETDVAGGEAGGITQHIGASVIEAGDGRRVVFIDTPGHQAFTRMRARGAKVTDIVVLVVAADDGVMPQTQEAIDHARAAKVPIVVAVNKVDKPDAQPERVKRQLADRAALMPEQWGGDTIMVEVSAKEKKNLDRLVEMLLLVADMKELKANPDAPATGTVLESRVDRGRGPVATVLVQNGTLNTGDVFICGAVYGKVRAMFDDKGHAVKAAGPSSPVEVLGLQGVPEAGDHFQVADEARARHIVDYRQGKQREASLAARSAAGRVTLDQLHEQLKAGEVKELPIVIKGDVQGSVEVLNEMLPKLSTDQVKVKILHASVGAVAETDVLLASASGAIIIAFNVRPERKAAELAQHEGVEIRPHTIIYELQDEMKKALAGMLEPVFKETQLGRAEVRDTFRIKGVGTIAGCHVLDGIIKRDAEIRVVRDGVVTYTGRVSSLKRFKDDASEVRAGFECGIGVSNFNDVKVGDVLECFAVQKVAVAEATA
ncbi:MAG: translation initiation factor IF-2 [Candidatus Acidiferrales bacterium]